MNDKDTITDLVDRLRMLRLRYGIVFRELTAIEPPYTVLAEGLARGLAAQDKDAVLVARSVIDPADTDRPEFWATPLGRLLFAAGGYPDETVTQRIASAVLGCSRQWVNALIANHKLDVTLTAVPEVFVDQVRGLLKTRMPELTR